MRIVAMLALTAILGCGSDVLVMPKSTDPGDEPESADDDVGAPYAPIDCGIEVCPTGRCGLEPLWAHIEEKSIRFLLQTLPWGDGFVSFGRHRWLPSQRVRWDAGGALHSHTPFEDGLYVSECAPVATADGALLEAQSPMREEKDGPVLPARIRRSTIDGVVLAESTFDGVWLGSLAESIDGSVWLTTDVGTDQDSAPGRRGEGDPAIVRMSPDLEVLDVVQFPEEGDAPWRRYPLVEAHPAGGVIAAVFFEDSLEVAGTHYQGRSGFVLVRLDAAATVLWSRLLATGVDSEVSAPGASYQHEHPIAVLSDGTILVSGSFRHGVDFGAGELRSPYGVFLAKLEPDGAPRWIQAFPGPRPPFGGFSRTGTLHVDAAGVITWLAEMNGIDLGGGAHPIGHNDAPVPVIARFHPCGEHMWSRALGNDIRAWLAPSSDGDFFLVANDYNDMNSGNEKPLAEFDIGGEIVRTKGQGHFHARTRLHRMDP